MPRVILYSRPRCGLCDRAREAILDEHRRTAFEFEEVDVEGDDDLERAFGLRVPVVVVDGEELFEVEVDPAGLHAALVRS
jgi:glutaredoxin